MIERLFRDSTTVPEQPFDHNLSSTRRQIEHNKTTATNLMTVAATIEDPMGENDESNTGATEPPPALATKKIITKAKKKVLYDYFKEKRWPANTNSHKQGAVKEFDDFLEALGVTHKQTAYQLRKWKKIRDDGHHDVVI
jgi:hypothetical protein